MTNHHGSNTSFLKAKLLLSQNNHRGWSGSVQIKEVISYKRGHKTVDNKGNTVEKKPEWKFFIPKCTIR